MHNKMLHICRVCGYCDEELFPWGEDGETPTFEICPCCNVELKSLVLLDIGKNGRNRENSNRIVNI